MKFSGQVLTSLIWRQYYSQRCFCFIIYILFSDIPCFNIPFLKFTKDRNCCRFHYIIGSLENIDSSIPLYILRKDERAYGTPNLLLGQFPLLCSHAALRESLLFRVAKIWVTVVQEFLQTSSRCTLNKHNLYQKATSLSQKNFVPDNTMRFSRSLLRYLLLTLFSRLLVIVRFLMLLLLRKMWIRTYM